ncbi:bifunctional PIG-L family deacetylase/class I SAM-dependent methyltransferase [Phycicoccus sp. HDW14]|uniref:bifunctional PIG-L family deacetylase/class I SAM-dependent methyltransferase n=1 Tax=Phycicoccus sp. HDW14 TaxID=2714941 RepID=UPI001409CFED|nr:bifunctional PIG-L family deacetylase/class I SAM-dependent methyltransferase [Phycicoccus sp. HDW14]QIM21881.1 bifunctional PIG-L family deacetylase/class I SAM-dependent methyltransferase [Phycicoccus sp. HDW14]
MSTAGGPAFHHDDPGTPEPTWLTDARWTGRPVLDLDALAARFDRLVVAAAHPDDETLAVGALAAAAHRRGADVRVVVASAGEASHPEATTWTPLELARVRRAEVAEAVGHLAPGAPVEHLDLPDGRLAEHEARLADLLAERCGPDTLLVAPWTADGHPDHDALGRAAVVAAARTGATPAHYPLWLWHWGGPDDLDWSRVHVVEPTLDDLARKERALAAHRSQTEPLGPATGDGPVVTGPVLARARRVVETLLAEPGTLPVLGGRDPDDPDRTDVDRARPFDAMFDGSADPWGFDGSFYEARKRAMTAALLGRERYRRVLEIGCATGVLTRDLAERADDLVAMDVSPRALEQARHDAPAHVRWVLGAAPDGVPDERFDLVVLSEVGYFLTPTDWLETLRVVRDRLSDGGEVVLVHWRHPTEGIPLDGPTVHAQATTALADLGHRAGHADADVLADVWGGPASVAADEGRR